jgi:hypothetical protein
MTIDYTIDYYCCDNIAINALRHPVLLQSTPPLSHSIVFNPARLLI